MERGGRRKPPSLRKLILPHHPDRLSSMAAASRRRINGSGSSPNDSVHVDLRNTSASFQVEWFNPRTAETTAGAAVSGGAHRTFKPPFYGDAILYLHRGVR